MTVYDSFTAWIDSFLSCIGGCLGCDAKGADAPLLDPTKEDQVVEKLSLSEDFWGTSTDYLDIPIGLCHRSFSSLSASNLSFPSDLGTASTNSRSEFINHGLLRWNQIRLQWIGATSSMNQLYQAQEPANSQSPVTCNGFLGYKDRIRPIPLSEVVDLLVDIWDQEGLYD